MRPESDKNKARDWHRNRRWRKGGWENPPKCHRVHGMLAYYNGKEARKNGNRAVRRHKDFIPDGGAYKKIYDVPWEIW